MVRVMKATPVGYQTPKPQSDGFELRWRLAFRIELLVDYDRASNCGSRSSTKRHNSDRSRVERSE